MLEGTTFADKERRRLEKQASREKKLQEKEAKRKEREREKGSKMEWLMLKKRKADLLQEGK